MKIKLTQYQIKKIVEMDSFIRMSKAWLLKCTQNNYCNRTEAKLKEFRGEQNEMYRL